MPYTDDDLEEFDARPARSGRRQTSSSGVWALILIIAAVVLGGGTLLCCGGLVYFGLNMMSAEVETELRDNARLREHIGEIQELTMDFTRSLASDDDDVFVYNVRGTKGSGKLTVHHITGNDGNEIVLAASLRLSDGRTIDLLEEEEEEEAETPTAPPVR